jgi:hypothetical protein
MIRFDAAQGKRTTVHGTWGSLAEPLHDGAAGPDDPPWRENAFFSFWDRERAVAGAIHVATSPNAEGRRARASVAIGAASAEIIEPLDPMRLTGATIAVDLEHGVRVDGPQLRADLTYAPRFTSADYCGFLAPLDDLPALAHWQQGADVIGWVEVAGTRAPVAGQGFRDRTWGYRDESRMFVEYLAGGLCFEAFDLSLIKQLDAGGAVATGGYALGAAPRPVVDLALVRSAAGLARAVTVTLADGEQLELAVAGPTAGFWVPMGPERAGPALSAYDEFVPVDAGPHGPGFGSFEHGILRRLT